MPSPPSVGNPSPGQLSPHQPPPTAVYHPPPPGAPLYPHPGHLPPQLVPPPTAVLIPPAQSTNYNTDRITNQYNYNYYGPVHNYYGPVHNSGQAQDVPKNRGMAQEDPDSAGAIKRKIEDVEGVPTVAMAGARTGSKKAKTKKVMEDKQLLENEYHPETLEFIEEYLENVKSRHIPDIFVPRFTFKETTTSTRDDDTIYINRKFKQVSVASPSDEEARVFDDIEDALEPGLPCLIEAEAGMGKSYFSSRLIHDWSRKKALLKAKLCINIICRGLDKDARLPLREMIFRYTSLKKVRGKSTSKSISFSELEKLARNGDLAIIVDGIDEIDNISAIELGKIRQNIYNAKKDKDTEMTTLDLVAGILMKELLEESVVIAAGRPNAVASVYKNLLNRRATVTAMMEFTEENIVDLVHKMSCSDNPQCKEIPLQLCHEIIQGFNDNPQAWELSRNPSLCCDLIQLFKAKVENGENIYLDGSSGSSVLLEKLIKNIRQDPDIGFTGLEDDLQQDLYETALLCQKSLLQGNLIIEGSVGKKGNQQMFIPKLTKTPISVESIEQMQVFRVTKFKTGQMSIETTTLKMMELFTAAVCCYQDIETVLPKLSNVNHERLSSILTYSSTLLKSEENSVISNFFIYMENMSGVNVNKNYLLQEMYKFVMNLPADMLPTEEKSKTINLQCYKQDKLLSNEKVLLLSKMVSTSSVPCYGLKISQDANKWIFTIENPGSSFRNRSGATASQTSDLLTFLDIQKCPPASILIKDRCYGGSLSVFKKYLEFHPNVTFNLGGEYPRVELYTQSDIGSYSWMVEHGHILPQQLYTLLCSVKLDTATIEKVKPYMLQVKRISVTCDQTDLFWDTMKDKIVEGEHNVTRLNLTKISVRPSIIDNVCTCLIHLPKVGLREMKMDSSKWNKLAEWLQRPDAKTQRLRLVTIDMNEETRGAIVNCINKVRQISMWDMSLDTAACQALADGFTTHGSVTQKLWLNNTTVEDSDEAKQLFTKIEEAVRVIYR